MTTTTAPVFMLKGDALVEFVSEKMQLINRNEMTRTEMILDAGYVYDNGKAMYTEFYTELLNAKGIKPTTDTDIEDQEYDDLSSDDKDLYDKITEMLGEKWTHEETIEFMDELEDIGIATASEFMDAYEYTLMSIGLRKISLRASALMCWMHVFLTSCLLLLIGKMCGIITCVMTTTPSRLLTVPSSFVTTDD
jgi:hypothetical protein